jgi:hypothetical protein
VTRLAGGLLLLLSLAPTGAAGAAERRCLGALYDGFARVTTRAGADARGCLRGLARGTLDRDAAVACLESTAGLAQALVRVRARIAAHCPADVALSFGPADGEALIAQAIAAAHDLTAAILDFDAAAGLASAPPGTACQQAALAAAHACERARIAAFTHCVRQGLRSGTIADASGLAACLDAAPVGNEAEACGARAAARVAARCDARSTLRVLVPGCVSDDHDAVAGCLARHAACRTCRALGAASGFTRDCDVFDDGLRNGSCGGEECDVLNQAECLLPFPSSRFLVPAATPTGYRVALPASGFPRVNGPATDPAPYNALDGFSPMAHPIMHFPQGVDPERSNAPRLLAPGCCGQPAGPPWIDTRTYDARSLDADSPSVLIDAETGERVVHFIEPDANASDPARQVLFLRPGTSLRPGHRYIVAMRNLVSPTGEAVEPEPPFRALRDGTPTTVPAIEKRRAHFETAIVPVLAAQGVPRASLVLAFDFVTQSDHALTHHMLAMRDQALAFLDGVAADPTAVPFTVTSVQTYDCDAPGQVVWRDVAGTFRSPLFLTALPTTTNVPGLNLDANDEPVQNGFMDATLTASIPCSALAGGPAYPLLLGHGFQGSAAAMTGSGAMRTGTPALVATAAPWRYVAAATNWLGFTNADVVWLLTQIVGVDGASKLNNLPALPARLRQALLNASVLARLLKQGLLNRDPAFQRPDGTGVLPGPAAEAYYYGVSLGGILGTALAAVTPDIDRFVLDVPAAGLATCLTQRSSQFGAFGELLKLIGLNDPMHTALALSLEGELFVSGEPGGYLTHVTTDRLPGSGGPNRILMVPAWLDKQVPNICTEATARTLGLPNLAGSIQQGLVGIPDLAGPLDSALQFWDLGAFDLFDPADAPFIPPLASLIPSGACDPHGARRRVPAAIVQIGNFLQPGGTIANVCEGPGNLCDGDRPFELPDGAAAPCNPSG